MKNVIYYANESVDTKPFGRVDFECGVKNTSDNAPHVNCNNF